MKSTKYERPIEMGQPEQLTVKRPFRWGDRVYQRMEKFSLAKLNDRERRRIFGMYEAGYFVRE